MRVLDGQLVQAEALADLVQLLGAGLEGAQPDEPVAAVAVECRRLVESQHPLLLTATVTVEGTVDDHGASTSRCVPSLPRHPVRNTPGTAERAPEISG